MTPFTTVTGPVAPLLRDNVDTDAIIPSREMRSTGRTGLADGLFAPWRYLEGRVPDPAFVLNQPAFARAPILAAGRNFGCGSSREHAVWALAEWGVRAVLAQSFAPIFAANALRNGLLVAELPPEALAALAGQPATIDLAAQTVTADAGQWRFAIDAEARTMMLEGIDVIDLTLKSRPAIDAWTTADRAARPWIYLHPPQSSIGEGDHAQQGGGAPVPRPLPKPAATVAHARALRRSATLPENLIWQKLRARPDGLKFRRQHPAGPYVLDFYCAAAKLAIELDGMAHDMGGNPARDARRDAFLQEAGVATLRLPAREVLADPDTALAQIVAAARQRTPLHHPAGGPPPQSEIGEDQ